MAILKPERAQRRARRRDMSSAIRSSSAVYRIDLEHDACSNGGDLVCTLKNLRVAAGFSERHCCR